MKSIKLSSGDQIFIEHKDEALRIRDAILDNMDEIEDLLNMQLKKIIIDELNNDWNMMYDDDEQSFDQRWLSFAREIFFAG